MSAFCQTFAASRSWPEAAYVAARYASGAVLFPAATPPCKAALKLCSAFTKSPLVKALTPASNDGRALCDMVSRNCCSVSPCVASSRLNGVAGIVKGADAAEEVVRCGESDPEPLGAAAPAA